MFDFSLLLFLVVLSYDLIVLATAWAMPRYVTDESQFTTFAIKSTHVKFSY
jgi:hypothetical protein